MNLEQDLLANIHNDGSGLDSDDPSQPPRSQAISEPGTPRTGPSSGSSTPDFQGSPVYVPSEGGDSSPETSLPWKSALVKVAHIATPPTYPYPAPTLEVYGCIRANRFPKVPTSGLETYEVSNSKFIKGYTVRPLAANWSDLDPIGSALVARAIRAGILKRDDDGDLLIHPTLAAVHDVSQYRMLLLATEFLYSTSYPFSP